MNITDEVNFALKISLRILILSLCTKAHALPIGFGHTEGGLEYEETISTNFRVYHDQETPNEAKSISISLEAAKPHFERWFGVERKTPLPVVSSSVASGASFANFITDAIELQTSGQGRRDLYWHELTHSIMYEHLQNWLGPAGSILHLLWLPSWFIEGLPESLTVSIGADRQASYERYHALSRKWPSYERLHSLYGGQSFANQGYAVSGSFLAYLFRTYEPNKLPQVMTDFYYNSMPWWYPWALVPFSPFLPLDNALEAWTGKSGEELYGDYKKAAEAYWELNANGAFLSLRGGARLNLSSGVQIWPLGKDLVYAGKDGSDIVINRLKAKKTGGFVIPERLSKLNSEFNASLLIKDGNRQFGLDYNIYDGSRHSGVSIKMIQGDSVKVIQQVQGKVNELVWNGKTLAWVETHKETTRLCQVRFDQNNQPLNSTNLCFKTYKQPTLVKAVGRDQSQKNSNHTRALFLRIQKQTLKGDVYSLLRWDIDSQKISQIPNTNFNDPRAVVALPSYLWVVSGERSSQKLRQINFAGACLGEINYADYIVDAWGQADGSLFLRTRTGEADYVVSVPKGNLFVKPCSRATSHISPMLAQMRSNKNLTLKESFAQSDLWERNLAVKNFSNAPPLNVSKNIEVSAPRPAKNRYRPIFAMPWIGAEALGYNFGTLAIPLMDERQNHSLQLTALVGLESRYPSLEASYLYTALWPTIKMDVFRYQEWNGTCYDLSNSLVNCYADRRGGRASMKLYSARYRLSLALAFESSYIDPYIGVFSRWGTLNKYSIDIGKSFSLGSFDVSMNLGANQSPASINANYDYYQLSTALSFSRGFRFLNSRLAFGLSGSSTKGEKTRMLREFYQPLRTFIPGSGGGFNNVSFSLYPEENALEQSSLFTARYGDTQARFSLNYTFPLIANVDQMIRMFYVKSLEFGTFLNYGGAWYSSNGFDSAKMNPAVGANADLLFEINGVKFNLGIGSGQVLVDNETTAVFARFGFDNLLEVNR
jgi:hypothetical protein